MTTIRRFRRCRISWRAGIGWSCPPRLRLATVTQAMKDLEAAAGGSAPEYSGEWTDWWANGTACAPREVAASRVAKRHLAAVESSVFGPVDAVVRERMAGLVQDLCLLTARVGFGHERGPAVQPRRAGQFTDCFFELIVPGATRRGLVLRGLDVEVLVVLGIIIEGRLGIVFRAKHIDVTVADRPARRR